MKQVFLEAAVDSPEMFEDGYTHYSLSTGFQKLESNTEIDDIIRYVKLINATETSYQASQFNMPHPKWFELRKRIDKAEKNSKGEWRLADVFVEATKYCDIPTTLRGIPYKDGIGIVQDSTG